MQIEKGEIKVQYHLLMLHWRSRDHTKTKQENLWETNAKCFYGSERQNERKTEEKVMGISNLEEKRSPYKVLGKASKN